MSLKQTTIYIADDDEDEDDQELLTEAINQVIPNADITCFLHGKQLIQHISNNSPQQRYADLIILDINMPIMDGIEALKEIRSKQLLHTAKVVFLSTTISEFTKKSMLELGAIDLYTKPFKCSDFIDIVRDIKEKHL